MFSKFGTKIALQRAGLGNITLPKTDNLFGSGNTNSASTNGAEGGNGGIANPFANVQWGMPKVLASWSTPAAPQSQLREPPIIGERAQSNSKLKFPAVDGRPCVVLFLRFTGCPFTEKLFLQLRSIANRHTAIHFIAISHCTPESTEDWVRKLGGAWNIDVIVDQTRELYALWGLGISNWGHVLNPRNGYSQYMLGKKEGVWGQPGVGEGGCRWQVGGAYAIDERGVVKWGGPMKSVDDAIAFEDGVKSLGY
ncbi:hypothetical protein J1614_009339 [Plenodomus biglobosus]|nr:hypothetical protein J1614_009339 [Plenodomus biglobosus]